MKSWLLLLACVPCLSAAQDPAHTLPSFDAQAQAAVAAPDWKTWNVQPNELWEWNRNPPGRKLFQWQLPNAWAQTPFHFEIGRLPGACVAPLLAAPVNPNTDPRMPMLHPPKSKSENAEITKGLPPCWSGRSQ